VGFQEGHGPEVDVGGGGCRGRAVGKLHEGENVGKDVSGDVAAVAIQNVERTRAVGVATGRGRVRSWAAVRRGAGQRCVGGGKGRVVRIHRHLQAHPSPSIQI